jgi:hypothetical protein
LVHGWIHHSFGVAQGVQQRDLKVAACDASCIVLAYWRVTLHKGREISDSNLAIISFASITTIKVFIDEPCFTVHLINNNKFLTVSILNVSGSNFGIFLIALFSFFFDFGSFTALGG